MKNGIVRLLQYREISILGLMIAYFLIVATINRDFITTDSILLLVSGSIILLIMAIGQSFVLFTSHIDVSVGSIMGISAAVCGTLLTSQVNLLVVIFVVILVGAVIGLINGLGVSIMKIPAIIMTLGTMGIIRGLMLLYTEGMWIEDIPTFYKKLAVTNVVGIPIPIWIGILLVIITTVFLKKTKFGRYFYAVGDNIEGAKLIGLPVKKVEVLAFTFSGISAAIAAMIFVMNIGFVPNQTGSGLELQVLAAAVLGGVSLSGGIGTMIGAALGAVFFTVINSSLVYMKIPAYWNNAISGLLLLIIVITDSKFQQIFKRKINFNVSEKENNKQGVAEDEDKAVS